MGRAITLAAMTALLALAACGKVGPPSPAGPPDKVIWPAPYPAE